MSDESIIVLTDGDLEGAAYLCLESAALTYLDTFPPGSGDYLRKTHHERKRRFEEARSKLQAGVTSLLELGLHPWDCEWAAKMAQRAKDPEGWRLRFQTTEENLKKAAAQGRPDADDEVDGRWIGAVSEYASTCDGCGELTMHESMWMDEETQLGYCEECAPEAKNRAARARRASISGET